MATKKQEGARRRIEVSKRKKSVRFTGFLTRLGRRRIKNRADRPKMNINFCCRPLSLGMPRDTLLAKGQQLVNGTAAFFDQGELEALLLRNWDCQNRDRPTILMRSYMEENYNVDGSYRDHWV